MGVSKVVHRQRNWNKLQVELTENLAHLVRYIKRHICDIASIGFRLEMP